MSEHKVKFRNVSTDVGWDGTVDDAHTVREVIDGMVAQHLIAPPKAGQQYVLQIKGGAELSDDNATMHSGGVKDGDLISVALTNRGGGQVHD